MNARLLILPLALALFGCTSQAKKPEAQGPQPYKFPHGIHVESGVACVECHAPILKTTSVKENAIDVAIPKKSEVCAACHDPIPDYKPVQRFAPSVRFDHAGHLPRLKGAKDECQTCHTKFTEPGTTLRRFRRWRPARPATTTRRTSRWGAARPATRPPQVRETGQGVHARGRLPRDPRQVGEAVRHHLLVVPRPDHVLAMPHRDHPPHAAVQSSSRRRWLPSSSTAATGSPATPWSRPPTRPAARSATAPGTARAATRSRGSAAAADSRPTRTPPDGSTDHGAMARQNILSCAGATARGAPICSVMSLERRREPAPAGLEGHGVAGGSNPTCKVCHTSP